MIDNALLHCDNKRRVYLSLALALNSINTLTSQGAVQGCTHNGSVGPLNAIRGAELRTVVCVGPRVMKEDGTSCCNSMPHTVSLDLLQQQCKSVDVAIGIDGCTRIS